MKLFKYIDPSTALDLALTTCLCAVSLIVSTIATYVFVFFTVKTWKLILGA